MLEPLISYHRRKLETCEHVIENENRMYPDAAVARAQIDAAQHRSYLVVLRQAQTEMNGAYPRWRHAKRQRLYHEIALATAQCEVSIKDNERVTLYRGEDGEWYVRPPEEFRDGRFVKVDDATT